MGRVYAVKVMIEERKYDEKVGGDVKRYDRSLAPDPLDVDLSQHVDRLNLLEKVENLQ
jgi:hypothetical protein